METPSTVKRALLLNSDIALWELLGGLTVFFIVYNVLLVGYRLYLSPLARFPGSKLAAASPWYESIIDIWSNDFHDVLLDMHRKHGPIVRCSPWELSINDGEFYNKLYVPSGTRRSDLMCQRSGLGLDGTIVTTSPHELHQLRRRPMDSFFSRQSITRTEKIVHSKARVLDQRLCTLKDTGSVVRLDQAYSACVGDIIIELAVGESSHMLKEPDFTPEWHNIMRSILLVNPRIRNFPLMGRMLKSIPMSYISKIYPRIAGFKMWNVLERIKSELLEEAMDGGDPKPEHSSIFHHLLRSDLPEFEKHASRLSAETVVILGGGSINPSATLTLITFYILSSPNIRKRLTEALEAVTAGFPERFPTWAEFEKVPYLVACVKEGLRINCQFRRSTRMAPDVELQYKEWTIPKNTPVGMTIYHMHRDPDVFSEPFKFKPERWLGDIDPRMNRNYVPWAKGSRDCLGKNLAYAELYIILGTLFRPGGPCGSKMILTNCDESDFALIGESEFGVPSPRSRGLSVKSD